MRFKTKVQLTRSDGSPGDQIGKVPVASSDSRNEPIAASQRPATLAPRKEGPLNTRRIEAFSDGVLSIVITLLVLQLSLPVLSASATDAELTRHLVEMIPKLFAYVISFAVVGIFWVGHHGVFHFVVHADRTLLWLNNLFLLSVGFIPFPAALLGA
jgi:uncharacterized membrane protein